MFRDVSENDHCFLGSAELFYLKILQGNKDSRIYVGYVINCRVEIFTMFKKLTRRGI